MPPRRKRIRSDDSENSTVDSRGISSGSDKQNAKNSRHQTKKINSEDYDGDCELDQPGKNRITRTATRSRNPKQKLTNSFENDSSSSTPVAGMEGMDVDQEMLGLERFVTPIPISPVPHYRSTPHSLTPDIPATKGKVKSVAMATPKPLFNTPAEKPGKKFKRKRVAKYRLAQSQNHPKLVTENEALMIAHFNDIEDHELLVE
ncbi:uncharacterized protein LOC114532486 [Dendronephthya gigantea]|uniref:uncharacterized protein LOC114532486 n=1 Tax=Dendronephthya gigantea TaxID=151771 RepID=UPI00106AC072|nr:uncharacterized protein LOC114532486 [Dendronephthya gigantea]